MERGRASANSRWSGLSDPALAWDDSGHVFLVGVAIKNPPQIDYVGIAVYKSTDGGQTWSARNPIHTSSEDEKPWAAGDSGSVSFTAGLTSSGTMELSCALRARWTTEHLDRRRDPSGR